MNEKVKEFTTNKLQEVKDGKNPSLSLQRLTVIWKPSEMPVSSHRLNMLMLTMNSLSVW